MTSPNADYAKIAELKVPVDLQLTIEDIDAVGQKLLNSTKKGKTVVIDARIIHHTIHFQ